METPTRVDVVAEAMSWVGTKYHHLGRIKGPNGGVDCAQLVWCVFHAVGLTRDMPVYNYSPQEFLHRDSERFLREIMTRAKITENPRPGDVVLYRMGRSFGHGGIVVEPGWPTIVHAHQSAGRVIVDDGSQGQLKKRKRLFFTVWDD